MKTKPFCFLCRPEECIGNHISAAQLNAVDVLHKGVLHSNSFSFSFSSVLFQSSCMLHFENMF